MHSQAAYNQIDAQAERIRASLIRKATKGQAGALQASIRHLESRNARGTITHEWITHNVTEHCRWGTRTAARRLAWDLYNVNVQLWQMLDEDA